MPEYYIGVKIIKAQKMEKDGQPGYSVEYEDGYVSWSPKEAFEKAYYPMGNDPSKVNPEMVNGFIDTVESKALEDGKTVFAKAELLTGFTQYETASCVDPKNSDLKTGEDICLEKVKDTIWKCLGFVVQWGRFGLSR